MTESEFQNLPRAIRHSIAQHSHRTSGLQLGLSAYRIVFVSQATGGLLSHHVCDFQGFSAPACSNISASATRARNLYGGTGLSAHLTTIHGTRRASCCVANRGWFTREAWHLLVFPRSELGVA